MPAAAATKSTDFWLHDGSIVLAAENTLFRVHQTILINHSEIFADLFSLPQPADLGGEDGAERIDGCRMVELHDSASDFEDLLRAIYHPSHFDKLDPAADLDALLTFIGGILRLSTKYIIHELRKRCIVLLVARFPTSYQEYMASSPRPYTPSTSRSPTMDTSASNDDSPSWNWSSTVTFSLLPTPPSDTPTTPHHTQPSASSSNSHSHNPRSRRSSHSHHSSHHHHRDRDRDKPSKSKSKDDSGIHHPPQPPKPKGSSIMRAIALASSTSIPTILPYAYYLLARTSEPRRYLSHTSSSLSWHDKTRALVGRAHLHAAETAISHSFLVAFELGQGCASPSKCKASRGPLVEWALLGTTGRGPEPLRPWERWERLGVCAVCVGHARRRHERGREVVWERLPEFFELGSWRALRAAQEM
ncbi:hypothetical protein D9615_010376 [Tricholomella constricta]|uniref:BTB domain-containing protein n=1 Tax=Tricholomella constricta TaxID=117010 RepID=A0A8H5GP88_9AGAR|nr:hypothetical protein D9615_010376 [Tricholomella constricta]